MIVVVPGSCPWVMLPDGKLIVVSFGCRRFSFPPPNTGFVVSLVCAVDWPGYFGKETSPRGRDLGLGLPARLTNGWLRCLQVPMGKTATRFSSLNLPVFLFEAYLPLFLYLSLIINKYAHCNFLADIFDTFL